MHKQITVIKLLYAKRKSEHDIKSIWHPCYGLVGLLIYHVVGMVWTAAASWGAGAKYYSWSVNYFTVLLDPLKLGSCFDYS